MTKQSPSPFTLIKGGKKTQDEWDRTFVSAYVTDTRLMGAMGLYCEWLCREGEESIGFHQFFYVETEEAGLETYFSVFSDNEQEVAALEKENIGGLGGKKVPLTESEFCRILRYYAKYNKRLNLPLPPGRKEYLPLIEKAPDETPEEARALLAKQCAPITSVYQLLNYFIMRSVGQDLDAASLLVTDELVRYEDDTAVIPGEDRGIDNAPTIEDRIGTVSPLYGECGIATLCKNTIERISASTDPLSAASDAYEDVILEETSGNEVRYEHSHVKDSDNPWTYAANLFGQAAPVDKETRDGTYLCDSLIEHGGQYEVVITKCVVENLKITDYKRTGVLPISTVEAATILGRSEYVTVFMVLEDLIPEDEKVFTLDFDSVSEVYEYGQLYFSFHDSNAHVDAREFRLSGDVRGVYYLTDFGQLVVMAYDKTTITKLEREISSSPMIRWLMLTDRYQFLEPVLYEFVQSDFEDFNEFVDAMRQDP